ncbi:MAG TPA: hypothetical protein VI685_17690 [Candidatus Angelobacter sp.]
MNSNDNRVLCRRGARELTMPETEFVVGAGGFHTLVCTAPIGALAATGTTTGPGDGDGCSDTDSDHG